MSTLSLDVSLDRPGFSLAVRHEILLEGITAVFGPSGSGKTTLLRVIAGLEREARGRIAFDGVTWLDERASLPTYRRGLGYVFQDGRLFAHLNVEQNLRFGLERASGAQHAARNVGFDDVVSALDLRRLLLRRPPSLSGGEQQRVAIARALLTNPRLLLMDEPLSSLDLGRKRDILRHIETLPKDFGVPVLYVTHNVDEVIRLAGNVVLVSAGRVAAQSKVTDIFERPELWSLVDGADAGAVLQTEVSSHDNGVATLRIGTQALRVATSLSTVGARLPIRIHARDVAIATVRPQHLSIRNVLRTRILRVDASGTINVELLLDVEGQHLRSRITRDALEELQLTPGQEVYALVKSVALENALLC